MRLSEALCGQGQQKIDFSGSEPAKNQSKKKKKWRTQKKKWRIQPGKTTVPECKSHQRSWLKNHNHSPSAHR
eukprot:m.39478 g.39478  ORF g.39478 m.39478 type:complete len:72 (-) comp13989_c0_seq1:18-233(-)